MLFFVYVVYYTINNRNIYWVVHCKEIDCMCTAWKKFLENLSLWKKKLFANWHEYVGQKYVL